MADVKELKPKSFRIDDETAEKIKAIANSIGGNQQTVFAKLIEAYEFQSGKDSLVNKREEIEKFERHMTVISRMFMDILEDNQCIAETIQTEFDALLKSKDIVIQDLQKKLKTAEQLQKEADLKLNANLEESVHLKNTIDKQAKEYTTKLENMQSMLNDKDELNKALTDSCKELKSKINIMANAAEQLNALRKEFDELNNKFIQTTKDKSDIENLLEQERIKHKESISSLIQHEKESLEREKEQFQMTIDKSTLKIEQKCQQRIEQLNSERQVEITAYLQKYSDLMEKNNNYLKQISELKAEIILLKNNVIDENKQ